VRYSPTGSSRPGARAGWCSTTSSASGVCWCWSRWWTARSGGEGCGVAPTAWREDARSDPQDPGEGWPGTAGRPDPGTSGQWWAEALDRVVAYSSGDEFEDPPGAGSPAEFGLRPSSRQPPRGDALSCCIRRSVTARTSARRSAISIASAAASRRSAPAAARPTLTHRHPTRRDSRLNERWP